MGLGGLVCSLKLTYLIISLSLNRLFDRCVDFFRNVRTGVPSRQRLRLLKDILLQLSSEKWHPEKEEDLFQWLTHISTAYRLAAFGTAHCNEGSAI